MDLQPGSPLGRLSAMAWCLWLVLAGCQTVVPLPPSAPLTRLPAVLGPAPRELSKAVLPEYVIEPPDILTIEAISLVPKSPYRLKVLDVLSIQVSGTLPESPVSGLYPIEPGGVVKLGLPYGAVNVAGQTVPEAESTIKQHLAQFVRTPEVALALAELGASQQVRGDFIVAPDGTVTLGGYGNVMVVGLTLAAAKQAIETHLSQYLESPAISVQVAAYNSKVYYIIVQGAGIGDGVYRLPVTGNETVLDAIAQLNGFEPVSSKRVWIARPSNVPGQEQILPVDWFAVSERGSANTNYQILPGDRVFIAEDKLVAFDNALVKLISPLERLMGFTLLGTETATRLSGRVLEGGGNPRGFGGF